MRRSSHARRGRGAPPVSTAPVRPPEGIPLPGVRLPGSDVPAATCAFTLIELLTVIAIIGILSAIVLGVGRRVNESGKVARTKAELAALGAALEAYRHRFGDYPRVASDSDVSSSVSGQFLFEALNGQRGPALSGALFAQQQRVFIEKAGLTLTNPSAADADSNSFLDPWGHPYHYVYTPGTTWKNSGYILFSVGPDGLAALPFPADGIRTTTYDSTLQSGRPVNVDNIYANQ